MVTIWGMDRFGFACWNGRARRRKSGSGLLKHRFVFHGMAWNLHGGAKHLVNYQIFVADLHHFTHRNDIMPTMVANGAAEARIMTSHRHQWTGAISASGSNVSGGAHRRRVILVVDDEPTIVELLASLLEDEGYAVLRAYDGEEALKIVAERSPDLVISDVSLPRLSGIDLLRRLRASNQPNVPVILMSAIVRDVPVGQATFIRKPFDLDHVLDMVESQIA